MFNQAIKKVIERDFSKARKHLEGRKEALFSVFSKASPDEILCLKYLYSYLPLSDLATYDGELFLKLSQDALKARELFPWAKNYSDEMFFNYVLAVRVNNEDLTDHRELIRKELEPRLRGKSMQAAALEVNLWAYEKATYQATDERTVSPLTIMKRTFGRCGEESTFVVSALRAVALPARQVYTPFWAHSDDNHAWVEVFTGDDWHYLGACEPEAVLDKAWFSAPAKRAMLMHTRIFSGLKSKEEIINDDGNRYLLNVSARYLDTARLKIKVTNYGVAVEKARVSFNVVNFASIKPIAILETNAKGEVSLTTGKGDLLIRVKKAGQFIEKKISLMSGDLNLNLDFKDKVEELSTEFTLDMRAPKESLAVEPEASALDKSWMELGKKRAEKVRANYKASFYTEPDAEEAETSLEYREAKVLANSLGNWPEIKAFLDETSSNLDKAYKLDLLEALRVKDLADSSCDLLLHHAKAAYPYKDKYPQDIFVNYLLNPRFANEMLTKFRRLKTVFNEREIVAIRKDPNKAYDYAHKQVDKAQFPVYGGSVDPYGLLELGIGSEVGRMLLTLSILRTLGIPARFNPQDHSPEFYQDEKWHKFRANLDKEKAKAKAATEVNSKLILEKEDINEDIEIGTQLGLASIATDGSLNNLNIYDLEFDEKGRLEIDLSSKHYQVLLAKRQTNGDNLVKIIRFYLEANSERVLSIALPELKAKASKSYELLEAKLSKDSKLKLDAKYNLLAILEPGAEPTEHFFNEILESQSEFKNLALSTNFMLKDKAELKDKKLAKVLKLYPEINLIYPATDFH